MHTMRKILTPRPVHEIERDVMRGKHVPTSELNRFLRHPKGQMLAYAMRGGRV